MGTNYYYRSKKKEIHIGKRAAAGLYCWDCKKTLCREGNESIHSGKSIWEKRCINCGQYPIKENLNTSSIGRELGFNNQEYKKKESVRSCSSFLWAINPLELRNVRKVQDEYGRVFTKGEFYKILEECPIQYFSLLGREFS